MSFLKRADEALDKLFVPKVDKIKFLELKLDTKVRGIEAFIAETSLGVHQELHDLILRVETLEKGLAAQVAKEVPKIESVEDLKTRLERLEIYSGLTRKVSPDSKPELKNAFQL